MAEKIEFDATGFTSLKSQIREANLEYQALLANVEATPEAVQAAADRVAGLKDQFNDANDAVNALTQQGKFQALTKGLAAVSGGFTAMQGAIGLVGGDVKDFEKTFQKLQSAMALTQGLTALADMGDAFGAIKVAAVGAFNSIKAAIGSTGIGLLIVGLGIAVQQLVSYMDELTESEKQNKNATEALSSAIQQQTLDYQSLNTQVQTQLTIDLANAELQKKSIEDVGKIRKKANTDLIDLLDEASNKRTSNYFDELALAQKSLGNGASYNAKYAELTKQRDAADYKASQERIALVAQGKLIDIDVQKQQQARADKSDQTSRDNSKKALDRKVRDLEARKALALAEVDQDKLQAQGFAKTEADKIRIENEAAQKRIQIQVQFEKDREALRSNDEKNATALEAKIQDLGNQRVEGDRKAQEAITKSVKQGITDQQKAEEDALKKAEENAQKKRKRQQEIIDEHFLYLELDAKNEIKNKEKLNAELERLELEREKKRLLTLEEGSVEYLTLLNQIKDKELAIEEDKTNKKLETLQKQVGATLDAANEVFNAMGAFNDRDQNREMEALKAKGLNEEQAAKETDEINRKYFEKNKSVQVGQAIINTLQSSISAFASLANIPVVGPVLGAIAASAALAAGYATVQKIQETTYTSSLKASSTQGSMYAEGGLLTGRSHDMGGIRTSMGELEGGEFVMNRRATANFLPLLESINSIGNTKGPEVAEAQQPIFKTYVVATEMSSQQEANAKLSALARM